MRLTEAHKALVRLLAAVAVEEFLKRPEKKHLKRKTERLKANCPR